MKLAAIRFTSYSNGPGSVSSKSFSRTAGPVPARRTARNSTDAHPRTAGPPGRPPASRQVRRHDLGRAPVEGERRDHHPAMPHRHQIRLPGGVLLLKQADRVRTVRGRLPLRMARQSRPIPGLQAFGPAIVDAQMRDFSYRHPAHLPFLIVPTPDRKRVLCAANAGGPGRSRHTNPSCALLESPHRASHMAERASPFSRFT